MCVHVQGPVDTPYCGGIFTIAFRIPAQYPLVPPEVRFATPFFHPNVHFKSGEICLDILKTAWSPAWTLQSGMHKRARTAGCIGAIKTKRERERTGGTEFDTIARVCSLAHPIQSVAQWWRS